ncbi:MAG: PhoH family protein [Verrucomicrobiota bacterium]|jgi:phosphate starvation-inducible PhoH-like protein|nr:PhoH family protein [Verrucomicrobiota bacterium]MDP7179116.1 PhoH family protein [Verrucomicrobiota bacterium]MDP7442434.1 PhoH family protein [Verrucomicrobiota bacterium]|tara:strand:+ start:2379 stop:3335 length:957 start_codon:yes stop_codon:yes gene_type:complete
MTSTLHYDNARIAQQLFNNNPKNLQRLEAHLGVKATSRDGWIKLDGGEADVARATGLFQSLESAVKAGVAIRNRDFSYALNTVESDGLEALDGLYSVTLQTSPRKPPVNPKTLGQKRYIEAIQNHDITFGMGPAGTGKTFLAMTLAVIALKEEKVSRIILTRPAVEAGEALGFLPGDLYEKLAPYLRPLHDALQDLLSMEEVQKQMDRGTIEIAPLAYMRGRTLNNAFIILDEAQNSTAEQMLMFLTRLGFNSKAVITGDPTQIDLPPSKTSGIIEARTALAKVEGIALCEFDKRDVVRHPLVQRIVQAYDDLRKGGE